MPPSGFNEKAIQGLLQFIQGCYEDLERKIAAGPGTPDDVKRAIREELDEIADALRRFNARSGSSERVPR
jgi:hypothetical protein